MATGARPVSSRPPQAGDVDERRIAARVEAARRRIVTLELITRLVALCVGLVAFFLLGVVLDHWLVPGGLPAAARWILALLAGAATAVWLGLYVLPLLVRRVNPLYAAQAIEQVRPSLKNSLISFLLLRPDRERFERDPLGRHIYHGLEHVTAEEVEHIPAEIVVDRTPLIRLGYVLAGLLAVFALYVMVSPKSPLITVERLLLPWSSVPPPTRVEIAEVEPGDAEAVRGDRVVVSARVRGLRDGEDVRLHFTTADGQAIDQALPMAAEAEGAERFRCVLSESIQQDTDYRIRAGDAESMRFHLAVRPPLSLDLQRIEYRYPAYTGLPTEVVEKTGAIRAVEGTEVVLHASANEPLADAAVEFDGDSSRRIRGRVDGETLTVRWRLRMDSEVPTRPAFRSYVIRAHAQDGRANRRPVRYQIEVVPDLAPEITWVDPPINHTPVPLHGSLPLHLLAEDLDFGLRRVVVRVQHEDKTLTEENLLDTGAEKALSGAFDGRYEFRPAELDLTVGDRVVCYAEAVDNRQPVGNRSETRRVWLDVVEDEQTGTQPQDGQGRQGDSPAAESESPQPNGGPPENQQHNGQGSQQPEGMGEQDPQAGTPQGSADEQQPAEPTAQGEQESSQSGDEASADQSDGAGGGGGQPSGADDSSASDAQNDASPSEDSSPTGESGSAGDGGTQGQTSQSEPSPGEQPDAGADPRSGGEPSGTDQGDSQGSQGSQGGQGGETGSSEAAQSDPTSGSQTQRSGEAAPGEASQGTGTGQDGAPQSQPPAEGQMPGGAGTQPSGSEQGDSSPAGNAAGSQGDRQGNQEGAQAASEQRAGGESQAPGGATESGDPQSPAGTEAGGASGERAAGNAPQQRSQPQGQETPADGSAEASDRADSTPEESQQGQQGQESRRDGPIDGRANPGEAFEEVLEHLKQKGAATDGAPDAVQRQQGSAETPPTDGTGRPTPETPETGDGNPQGATGSPESDQASPTPESGADRGGGPQSDSSNAGDGTVPKEAEPTISEETPREAGESTPPQGRGEQSGENEPQSPPMGASEQRQRPSDTESESSGDRAGSGEQGGGQQSQRPGLGNPGSNMPADTGGNLTQGPGSELGAGPGDRPQGTSGEGQTESGPQRGGEQGAAAEAGGRPRPSRTGEQSATEVPGAGNPTRGGLPGDQPPPTGVDTPTRQTETEDPVLEYARQQTDLALEYLEDQVEKRQVDPELLDRLGWSEQELNEFVRRWNEMKTQAEQAPPDNASARRYREMLKSLGLRPQGTELRSRQGADDTIQQMESGRSVAPPPQWDDSFRAYLKSLGRSQ